MAGRRRAPNRPGPNQGRPNQTPNRQAAGFNNDYRIGKGGQLSVGTKGGGRSWLGQAETEEGSLVPMGKSDNGYMQYGRVPIGNYFNVDPNSQGTPFARAGEDRAGFANNFSWDPKGKANTKAWQGMLGTGGYKSYGQATGVFAENGQDWNASRQHYGIADPSTQKKYGYGSIPQSRTGGHLELGQKGQDTGHGMRQSPRGQNSPGGMPGAGPGGGGRPGGNGPGGGNRRHRNRNKGLPNLPPPQAGGGMMGGVGEFPKDPTPPDDFLPMTPGYEQDWRGLNDQLGAAEGQFAQGQALLPAQYQLQNTRLQNDQDLATQRLKEDLANRGVYTAKNAAGTYGGTSPTGGGIGETMYSRNVATPYGRQFQDLAAEQAGRYNSLYGDYAGANLGYAQGINQALLNRANEAYELDPMGLANSGYSVPDIAAPYYPFAPQGRPTTGQRRPRKGQNKKSNKKKGGKK